MIKKLLYVLTALASSFATSTPVLAAPAPAAFPLHAGAPNTTITEVLAQGKVVFKSAHADQLVKNVAQLTGSKLSAGLPQQTLRQKSAPGPQRNWQITTHQPAVYLSPGDRESMVNSAKPQAVGTLVLSLGSAFLPPSTVVTAYWCQTSCTKNAPNYFGSDLHGLFSVQLTPGLYQVGAIASFDGAIRNQTPQAFATITANKTVTISLDLPTSTSLLSGYVNVTDASGSPVSTLSGSQSGNVVVAVLCSAKQYDCYRSLFSSTPAVAGVAIANLYLPGQYSYQLSVTSGNYILYTLYIDTAETGAQQFVTQPLTISLNTGDTLGVNQILPTSLIGGTLTINNLPPDAYPAVLECQAPTPSFATCIAADKPNGTASSSLSVLGAQTTHYDLSLTGALYAAAGWMQNGSFYFDPASTHTLDGSTQAPDLTTTWHAPTLSGVVQVPAGSSSYVEACPSAAWRAFSCTANATIAPVQNGKYSAMLAAGTWTIFATAVGVLDQAGIYVDASTPVASVEITTQPATKDFAVAFLGTAVSGAARLVGSPTQTLVVACPGSFSASTALTTSCANHGGYWLATSSDYAFSLDPGTWTIYSFDQNFQLFGYKTMSVAHTPISTDLIYQVPTIGVYGAFYLNQLSDAQSGEYAYAVACPAAASWTLTCAGRVSDQLTWTPSDIRSSSSAGEGAYGLRLSAGKWRVALDVHTNDREFTNSPKLLNVQSSVRYDFTATDNQVTLYGNVYDTNSDNLGEELNACPTTTVTPTCTGGIHEYVANSYALALPPGTWHVNVSFLTLGQQVLPTTPVVVHIDTSMVYQDLFTPSTTPNVYGTASVVGATSGAPYVVACQSTDVATCQSPIVQLNVMASNAIDDSQAVPPTSYADASGFSGLAGPYSVSVPYSLVVPGTGWYVAAADQFATGPHLGSPVPASGPVDLQVTAP